MTCRPAPLRLLLSVLLDGAVMILPTVRVGRSHLFDPIDGGPGRDGLSNLMGVVGGVAALLAVWAVTWLAQTLTLTVGRRTLGMWICRVRFVRVDDTPYGPMAALLRGVLILGPLAFAGAVIAAWSACVDDAGTLLLALDAPCLAVAALPLWRERTATGVDRVLGTVAVES